MIREPDEITLSIKQEQTFIKAKKDSKNELLLIAEIGGKHIGNCSLMSVGGYKRYMHRCDIAEKVGYTQAELEVIADNKPAIVLYEELGFEIYGTFPNNMKYADGSYVDVYWMMKKLGI